ncbi:MAG: gamma-glutamylcyclotransferase [Alphaproteobacteria bacterium]|nr:gamma-glutamylcyclotransferase [Alphaproteobacteria bacterium]
MTHGSSDDEALRNHFRPSGPDGQLAREDFTAERFAFIEDQVRKNGGMPLLSQEERDRARADFLAHHTAGEPLWVFGYGSLMWNPAIHVTESDVALLRGYQRRFCLQLMMGRGSPERPGLMLALDVGGACHGLAHLIAPESVESETNILWMREMLSGAYHPAWVDIEIKDRVVRGLTFVINHDHPRYVGWLSEDEVAHRIAQAEGLLGTNRDYLFRCARLLEERGMADPYVQSIHRRVEAILSHTPEEER